MIVGTKALIKRLATPQIVKSIEKPLKHLAVGLKSSFISSCALCANACIFNIINLYYLIINMKFSTQFEFHKIPEWYSEYLDYKRFKAILKAFKLKVKGNFNY